MITDAVLNFLHGLAVTLSSFLQSALPAAPSFIADLTSGLSTAFDMVPSGVRYFIPIAPVIAAVGTYYAIVLTLGAVRFARRVLSLFTGGGGNA